MQTEWIVSENSNCLIKRAWQFTYIFNKYRLNIYAYYQFERDSKDKEYKLTEHWTDDNSFPRKEKIVTETRRINRNDIPMPSGIFILARESAIKELKIENLKLPEAAYLVAVSELKKQIKYGA